MDRIKKILASFLLFALAACPAQATQTVLEEFVIQDNTGSTNPVLGMTLKSVRITEWPVIGDTNSFGLYYKDSGGNLQFVVFDGTNTYLQFDGTNVNWSELDFATGMPIYVEADPAFTNWLATTGTVVGAESDPVFTNWLATTGGGIAVESDPVFTNWLATTGSTDIAALGLAVTQNASDIAGLGVVVTGNSTSIGVLNGVVMAQGVSIGNNASNIAHNTTNISGVGLALTNHISDTANPHATDLGNLGSGTIAELNALVTDATVATGTPLYSFTEADPIALTNAQFSGGASGSITGQTLYINAAGDSILATGDVATAIIPADTSWAADAQDVYTISLTRDGEAANPYSFTLGGYGVTSRADYAFNIGASNSTAGFSGGFGVRSFNLGGEGNRAFGDDAFTIASRDSLANLDRSAVLASKNADALSAESLIIASDDATIRANGVSVTMIQAQGSEFDGGITFRFLGGGGGDLWIDNARLGFVLGSHGYTAGTRMDFLAAAGIGAGIEGANVRGLISFGNRTVASVDGATAIGNFVESGKKNALVLGTPEIEFSGIVDSIVTNSIVITNNFGWTNGQLIGKAVGLPEVGLRGVISGNNATSFVYSVVSSNKTTVDDELLVGHNWTIFDTNSVGALAPDMVTMNGKFGAREVLQTPLIQLVVPDTTNVIGQLYSTDGGTNLYFENVDGVVTNITGI